ncbi:MAG TPA: OsmC family protein [Phycisphaerales bacterium]|nr:OsmC family protein [Phycisphaerales bacterium]
MQRQVSVSLGREAFSTAVAIGPHALAADEPAELGGGDTGPTPVELLLASLASCKAITVKMYADRKQWPLERVEVVARAASMHGAVIASIETQVRASGDLSEDQRARLLEIAEKCPVQKAITSGVRIEPHGAAL